jgi:hypothetical protein
MESKKVNDISIEPLTTVKKNKREVILDILPDAKSDRPFWMLVSAKVASGKSVLISNLLRRKEMYHKIFDKVYFCSSNIKDGEIHDSSYDGVHFKKSRMFDDFSDEIFQHITDDIMTDSDFKENAYLLVVDDLAPAFERPSRTLLKKLLQHRHFRLSLIIVGHAIRLFNPKIRQNCSHLVAFFTDNRHERTALNEITNLDQDTFDRVFDYATKDPYCFLYINMLTPRRVKAYKNFNEEILY